MGYIGEMSKKNDPVNVILAGLKREEYRGYDSAGISFFNGKPCVETLKVAGKIAALERLIFEKKPETSHSAIIGHTRWATHGIPNEINAHPHTDCGHEIAVVHNGIIENYKQLRNMLGHDGHKFVSSTDTEVIPHLIERARRTGSRTFEESVMEALKELIGSFAVLVLCSDEPDKIIAARRGSPLLLGLGEKEFFVASDPMAICEYTDRAIYLNDGEMTMVTEDGYEILNYHDGSSGKSEVVKFDISLANGHAKKGEYEHFMLKEISEAPEVIFNACKGRIDFETFSVTFGELDEFEEKLKRVKKIMFAACGTSYYASLSGKYIFEKLPDISGAEAFYASEFRYHHPKIDADTLLISISQSGETADTLEALREAKKYDALTLGIVNVSGSAIAREVDIPVYCHAGPEIAVASTKAFISQVVVLAAVALRLSELKGGESEERKTVIRELGNLPEKVALVLAAKNIIRHVAEISQKYGNFLYLGRRYNWPTALEGALKLKEISYIHAEGYPSGEMKHGPLALVDNSFPTFAIAVKDEVVYDKVLSNLQELKARGGPIIAVATEGDSAILELADHVIFIPETLPELSPILAVIPCQLFAYFVAVLKKRDIDQPRNLAKSVTVE